MIKFIRATFLYVRFMPRYMLNNLFVTNGITLSKLNYNFKAENTSPSTAPKILFDDLGGIYFVNALSSWKNRRVLFRRCDL